MRIERVLLVCSGNTCRSPMAARLLEHLWERSQPAWRLRVRSAGTNAFPGAHVSEHAVTAMNEWGLDLVGHRSKPLSEELIGESDLVLTMATHHKAYIQLMCPSDAHKVYTIGEYAGVNGEVGDPYGGPLAAYRETAAGLERLLAAIVQRIRSEGSNDE